MAKLEITIDKTSIIDIVGQSSSDSLDQSGGYSEISLFTEQFVAELEKITSLHGAAVNENNEIRIRPFLNAEELHLYWLSDGPIYGMIDFTGVEIESKIAVKKILEKMAQQNTAYVITIKASR